ncbi:NAD(P)-dependent oxidoreductase [Shewanella sp. Choline-02u-19]|uniref:NAD(P)-dependent oxidoreductase n=1 Tax=unclassified Shewanella TaxID=196818 RepID=UPI000C32A73F|nr:MULTISPECIES: NAD(P)-dependent oxidoreductase [unclassified Shewanella]PKH55865.1 NAD(P)-dependent oxidoreductase [Shewanella sp. Bg11-22]PKI27228.1 NAD(P)-dependent oxidoreductase [Shewanella sp. Choline-02u-19]
MIKSVCIVGCGWFGLPLAQAMVAQGIRVNGSKRNAENAALLTEHGINGFTLDLSLDEQLDQNQGAIKVALNTDCLVVNIPPSLRKDPDGYLVKLARLKTLIHDITYQKIIFISTTGVYPSLEKLMIEKDAVAHSEVSGKLLQAEAMFSALSHSCIARFAGLVGPERHPGRFLAGKTELSQSDAPVNIVHLNDCILAVSKLVFEPTSNGAYNVCAPKHPARQSFYQQAALDLGLVAPQFIKESGSGKIISSDRLMKELNFEYQFSDPMDMLVVC